MVVLTDNAAALHRASLRVDMLWGLLGFQWEAFKASTSAAERDVRAAEWLSTKSEYDEACEDLQTALLAR